MPTLVEMRIALEVALLDLTGWRVAKGGWSDDINVSGEAGVLVVEYDGAQYGTSFGKQSDAIGFKVFALASTVSNRTAREKLDRLCDPSPDSATSLRNAIDADPTLGDVVAFAFVATGGPYGEIEFDDAPYFGCEFELQVDPR